MANYYDYNNGNQQSGGTSGGFYGGGGFNQQQEQQQPGGGSFGGYNAQQWQAPTQTDPMLQQQQGGYPGQPMQPQQGGGQQQYWNPALGAIAGSMNNEAIVDIAGGLGRNFLQSSWAKMIPGLETAMVMLRDYFAVDNNYVKTKMQKILFPFRSTHWKRVHKNPPQPDYALPNADENAPDLYLPLMSLITYVLLCALCYGTAKHFDPEVIPDVTTKCFVTQILEVLAMRFGYHLMNAPVPILDLFSYTGYKYVGLSINMFVGLMLAHFGYGHRAYYITFLWTASAITFFMLKTMANNIPVVTAATGPKREVMVVAFAGSQFATMWFVSQTKFL